MKEIWNLEQNFLQNVAVIGQTFKFEGFPKEDFLSDKESFIYNFTKEIPVNTGFNFWVVGKKHKWNDIVIKFDNYYYNMKKRLIDRYNVDQETMKEIDDYYEEWKKNMKGIINNSLKEENYFASFLPTDLLGYNNNINKIPLIKNKRGPFMRKLSNIPYNIIFKGKNIKAVKNVPIYPTDDNEIQFSQKDLDFSKEEQKFLDDFVDKLYNLTIDKVLKPYFKKVNDKVKSKKVKEQEKEIYEAFLSAMPNVKYYGEQTFYSDVDYLTLNDFYFYPRDSLYLKITDVNFLTKRIGKEVITNADIGIIKEILRNAVRNDEIEYYTMKSTIIKYGIKMNINYDPDKEVYYSYTNNNEYIHGSSTEEIELNKLLGENFNYKFGYGLTLGIYSTDTNNIYRVLRRIIDSFANTNISPGIELFEKENLFQYNNYLSIGGPNDLNYSNYNGLLTYLINDRIMDIQPYQYRGLDYSTKTPILRDPFEEGETIGKHMAVIGDTGQGKTVRIQSWVSSILREKLIAIDPTGSLSQLSSIFPVTKLTTKKTDESSKQSKNFKLLPNPLYINKDFNIYKYTNPEENYTKGVDLILRLFDIKFSQNEENFKKSFINIFIRMYYYYEGAITINELKEFTQAIYKYNLEKELKEEEQNIVNYTYEDNIVIETLPKDFITEKLGVIVSGIENIKGNKLYDILMQREDFFEFLWTNDKIIVNIQDLKIRELQEASSGGEQSLGAEQKINAILFETLVKSITNYLETHSEIVSREEFEFKYEEKKKTYWLFDEMHFILRNPLLAEFVENQIRVARNNQASVVMLTQYLKDLYDEQADVYGNISTFVFMSKESVGRYLQLQGVFDGGGNKKGKATSRRIEMLKMYYNLYEEALNSKDNKDKTTISFIHYMNKEVFISYNQLSSYLLKNQDILKT